jgi:6-phosphogluconolactonase
MGKLAPSQQCRWHLYADAQAVQERACHIILRHAQQAIARNGEFRIVLAGGATPRALYTQLRHAQSQWRHWHIYFGDERCLPVDHAERNSVMADTAWLRHVDIPADQIHPIPAEKGAESGAAAYSDLLHAAGPFDLVLLGLGEDGHTASLFPGHDWGIEADTPPALAVLDAPKPPAQRVSLSAWRLSLARQVLFLVTGAGKRPAVTAWRQGKPIPAGAIQPPDGVDILLTQDSYAA